MSKLVEALNSLSSKQLQAQRERQRLYDSEKVAELESEVQNLRKVYSLQKETESKLKVPSHLD